MQQSRSNYKLMRQQCAGFTLIEVIVVLLILAIMTAIAVLVFSDFGRSRQERVLRNKIQQLIPVVQQQAILRPAVIGMRITKHGYHFYQLWQDAKTHQPNWRALSNDQLSEPRAFDGFNVQLNKIAAYSPLKNNKTQHPYPTIVFLPSGYITPFELSIKAAGEKRYLLKITHNGTIKTMIKTNANHHEQ